MNTLTNKLIGLPLQTIKLAALLMLKAYKLLISPLLPKACRFHPTCSQYCAIALRKYGIIKGGWKGVQRLLRCHPFGGWEVDEP